MILSKNIRILLLLLGDLVLFYLSLYLALTLRYQGIVTEEIWAIHQIPFFFIHLIWLVIFYIGGLYEIHIFGSFKKILERVLKSMAAVTIITALLFYLTPGIEIAPKTNLFIDVIVVSGLLILWRRLFWDLTGKTSKIKVLFYGSSKEAGDLAEGLKHNTRLGYEPAAVLDSVDHNLITLIKQQHIELIVASKNIMYDEEAAKRLYEALPLGVTIIDFENYYESITEKIPVSIINESWFLENLLEINKRTFEIFKRFFDVVGAIILGIPSLLIAPLIILTIKIESPGPIFYKQKRAGKNGSIFEIIKFRSMKNDAEKNGAQWAGKNDSRITKTGKFLRKTRLDELPQLWNVLRGEMSFIGPRPERPEFTQNLEKEIPHYAMRYLVKPGLSGWAQIKFPYGASIKDALEKLQYDLYYIKNRSLILDLAIAAKTVATLLSHQGR